MCLGFAGAGEGPQGPGEEAGCVLVWSGGGCGALVRGLEGQEGGGWAVQQNIPGSLARCFGVVWLCKSCIPSVPLSVK